MGGGSSTQRRSQAAPEEAGDLAQARREAAAAATAAYGQPAHSGGAGGPHAPALDSSLLSTVAAGGTYQQVVQAQPVDSSLFTEDQPSVGLHTTPEPHSMDPQPIGDGDPQVRACYRLTSAPAIVALGQRFPREDPPPLWNPSRIARVWLRRAGVACRWRWPAQ